MSTTVELSRLDHLAPDTSDHQRTADSHSPSRPQLALPPTDQGLQAWVALAGGFLSNALIWGFALSFGVLQEYYASTEPFAGQGGIAAIGTTSTGIMYLTMPLFLWIFRRWPKTRRWSLWSSVPIVAISLVGASFANTVPQLLVTQGIFYAIAGNALVMPTINFINEWFSKKRGLAIGIAISGDFAGGIVMPLLLQAILGAVGFRWTLRIIAAIIVVFSSPILFLLKPRLPVSATHVAAPMDLSFLRDGFFWTLQLFNTVQALGYFLPNNYLPTIAQSLGLGRTLGSLTVLIVNFGAIFGCVGVGALVDRFDVTLVLFAQGLLASVAVIVVLGLTTNIAPLFIFSLMYGLTAAAYSTAWGGIIHELQRKNENTDANIVFGLLALGRGVGSIISGPLSEALVTNSPGIQEAATSAYTSKYGSIIIFTGCTALAGGFGWFFRKARLI
ncbi:putative MFS monocarboxylate transporter [Hortaea werneckii]|nr:putative MFS monocarboxylate transporter [Hortaea werneckii]KAI7315229.1 putative MFS monocarboxylate transporter [Hortaea werneckii]